VSTRSHSYSSTVHAALLATPINELLARNSALILERIARGGGATNWFYCNDQIQLKTVEAELSPGSVVSFYFDGRFQNAIYSSELRTNLEKVFSESGNIVLGVLGEDGLHLKVAFADYLEELKAVLPEFNFGVRLYYGAFPGRDNDGIRAVTVILPDEDGIVRAHPH
jgi:hypothetical protein